MHAPATDRTERTVRATSADDPIDLSILASARGTQAFLLMFAGLIFCVLTSRAPLAPHLSLDLLVDALGWGMILVALRKIEGLSPRVTPLRTLTWILLALSIPVGVHVDAAFSETLRGVQAALLVGYTAVGMGFAWQLAGLIRRMAEVTREPELAARTQFRRKLLLVLCAVGAFLATPAFLGTPLIPATVMTLGGIYLLAVVMYLGLIWQAFRLSARHIRYRVEGQNHGEGATLTSADVTVDAPPALSTGSPATRASDSDV